MTEFRVCVSGWRNSRRIVTDDNATYFAVAIDGHCPTCKARVREVSNALFDAGVFTDWVMLDGSNYGYVSLGFKGDKKSVCEFLSRVLNRRVTCY